MSATKCKLCKKLIPNNTPPEDYTIIFYGKAWVAVHKKCSDAIPQARA